MVAEALRPWQQHVRSTALFTQNHSTQFWQTGEARIKKERGLGSGFRV